MNLIKAIASGCVGLVLFSGCTLINDPPVENKVITPPPLQITAAPPVRPDDVTTANARSKAQLLADEMERDGR